MRGTKRWEQLFFLLQENKAPAPVADMSEAKELRKRREKYRGLAHHFSFSLNRFQGLSSPSFSHRGEDSHFFSATPKTGTSY